MKNNFLKLLSITLLLFGFYSYAQVKSISEEPINLSEFSFEANIEVLFPDKYKSKIYKNYYSFPGNFTSITFQKEETKINRFESKEKTVGVEYLQKNSSNMDTLAVYYKQAFNRINFATDLSNNIFAICAVSDEMEEKKIESLINKLTKNHGKFSKTEGEFGGKFYIYEWETNSKIIRFSTVFNDEKNALKVTKEGNNLKTVDKEPHYEGYLYLIKKEKLQDTKNLNTGDFVFID